MTTAMRKKERENKKNILARHEFGIRAAGCAKWNEAFKEPLYQFYFYITGILVEYAHVFRRLVNAISV